MQIELPDRSILELDTSDFKFEFFNDSPVSVKTDSYGNLNFYVPQDPTLYGKQFKVGILIQSYKNSSLKIELEYQVLILETPWA